MFLHVPIFGQKTKIWDERKRPSENIILPGPTPEVGDAEACLPGVSSRMIRHSAPASPPDVSCNRNRNTPMVPFRFRAGNCAGRAHPLWRAGRSIPPSMAVLHRAEDRKNTSPPSGPRLFHSRVPYPCREDIHHRQWNRARACGR
jgi:hypothetical protein